MNDNDSDQTVTTREPPSRFADDQSDKRRAGTPGELQHASTENALPSKQLASALSPTSAASDQPDDTATSKAQSINADMDGSDSTDQCTTDRSIDGKALSSKNASGDTQGVSNPEHRSSDVVPHDVTQESATSKPTIRWLFGFRTPIDRFYAALAVLATVLTVVTAIPGVIDLWRGNPEATQIPKLIQGQDETNDKLKQLIAQSADKARELELTEELFISLAKRIARDVADIDQAYIELERVVQLAAEAQATGELPSNTDEAVKSILARVDELNAIGQIDAGAELLVDVEPRARANLRLIHEKGIAQAILTRDVLAARDYELKKISLDILEPVAQFDALSRVQDDWYVRGRDKGLNFDLEVSIALARTGVVRSINTDERGWAFSALGLGLFYLGERNSDTARLEEAVLAYRTALEIYTRAFVPLQWAGTQNNLGAALGRLGERDRDTARLEEAVVAYNSALEVFTRQLLPLDWASMQNNLGTALWKLSELEGDTARLEKAVVAFRAALEEYTRHRVPLRWAMAQHNLGSTLGILGGHKSDTDQLEVALVALNAALEERTRDRVPLDWAATQHSLGERLGTLGKLDSDTNRLEVAVVAFRAALKERSQERVPLDWAATQNNLGHTLVILGELEGDAVFLEEAVVAYSLALEEYTRPRVPLDWARTTMSLALAEIAIADHPATTDARSHLATALGHAESALEVFNVESSPNDHDNAARVRDRLRVRLNSPVRLRIPKSQ